MKSVDNVKCSAEAVLPESSEDVLELIHQLMHQYRSLQFRVLREGPHELTHMESKVLAYFCRRPGATQSDLVTHTGRDKAQLARLIKSLRERGWLLAQADPQDKRNLRLTPSAEGLAVQAALAEQARQLGAQAVADLSEDEQASLKALLGRVRRNLGDGAPTPGNARA